jgi:hypothetical protein
MSIPEDILFKYIIHVAVTEKRVISYKDCIRFYFEEQEYTMAYGTFRNKISNLKKNKKVVKVFHSNIAFYKPVGYDVNGKGMTDNVVVLRIYRSTDTMYLHLWKPDVAHKSSLILK